MSLQRMSTMLFNFVKLTVLTYFLTPSEFGVFGVAIISLDILAYFSKTGFKQAIIQKKGEIGPYLNSAWTFGLLRSFFLAILLFFLAPVFARFFHSPESILVIRAISAIFVVNALINVADLYLEKNLNFKKYFFYQTGGDIIDFVVSIAFAVILKNYWALFIGYISRGVFKCILSYIIFTYKPRLELHLDKLRELFHFGKWIFASSVILVLAMYLDNILVGKLIGIAALGLYQVAFKFSHTGSGEIGNVVGQIYFPYFSVIQDDSSASGRAYLNLVKINVILMSYLVTGMVFLAPAFTILFLRSDWHPIIPVIQILAAASFFNSVIETGHPFFKGKGNPRLIMAIQLIKVVSMVAFIFLLSGKMGMNGVALSVLIADIITFAIWVAMMATMIKGFPVQFMKVIIAPVVASGIMAATIVLFGRMMGTGLAGLNIPEFFACGLAATFVFAGLMFLFIKMNPAYGEGISPRNLFSLISAGKKKV